MGAIVYGVCIQKGGAGKSTSTYNLGVAFAGELNKEGKKNKVLLIDCDPQGSLSLLLGISRLDLLENTIDDLMKAEVKGEDYRVEDYILSKDGLDYIPANIILAGTEMALMGEMCREQILRNIISQVKDKYDIIIFDAPPSLSLMSLNIMTASDKLIIPVPPDFLAIKGLEQLFMSYRNIRKKLNPTLEIAGIFYTQFVEKQKNSQEIAELLESLVGNNIKIYNTKIPMSVKVKEAASNQISIFEYAPKNPVSIAYRELASEIIAQNEQE